MKKSLYKMLAVLAVIAVLCGVLPVGFVMPAAADTTNLIVNGDFETGDLSGGWMKATGREVTTTAAKDGTYGASLTGGQYAGLAYDQAITVDPSKTYVLSFDHYGVDITAQVWVKIQNAGSEGGAIEFYLEGGANQWKRATKKFSLADKNWTQIKIIFYTGHNSTATRYFDNVSLTAVETSFDGFFYNGGFETGDKTGGWAGNSATVTADARKDGNYGVNLTGSAYSGLAYNGPSNKGVTVDPSKTYILAFDHMGVNISDKVWVKFLNADNENQSKETYLEASNNQWKRVTYSFSTSGWGDWTHVKIIFYTGSGSTATRYFDNITLIEVNPSNDGYFINGDFETGDKTGGWAGGGVTVTTAAAKDGIFGANLTGSRYSCLAYDGPSNKGFEVDPDSTYTLSFDSMGVGSIKKQLEIKFVNANDENQSKSVYLEGGVGEWKQTTYSFSTAGWGNWTRIKVLFYNDDWSGTVTRYFDNIRLVEVKAGEITNGDFELGDLTGWSAIGTVEATAEAAKDGSYGAKVTSTDSLYQGLFVWVNVEQNTDYLLTFDQKSDSSERAVVYIKNQDETNLMTDYPDQVPGRWSRHSMVFNSGDNTRIAIQICVGATNTVRYFDNVSLQNLADTENTVTGGLGSVSEQENGKLGVAFKFDLDAAVTYEAPYTFTGGTVVPSAFEDSYTLVKMGAVLTNKAANADKLTLEDVDSKSIINIEAEKVIDVTATTVSYAVRVINIPATATGVMIYARPYYVYNNGSEDVVVYSATYSESYDSITARTGYTDPTKWELYWSDEFGGTELDKTKWTPVVQMEGSGDVQFCETEENLQVVDGNLVITTKKETVGDAQYTAGYVNTAHQFSFLYGRLEFRVKLPYGKGVWPALWTLGDYSTAAAGWPYDGEIDILELIGKSNTDPMEAGNSTVTHNLHWGADPDRHLELGSYKTAYNNRYSMPTAPSADYHVYAIEWAYREIKFFVDDVLINAVRWGNDGKDYLAWYDKNGEQLGKVYQLKYDDNSAAPVSCADLDFAFANPENKHFLIMSVTLCEGWGDMSNKADGGNLPQAMYVDYVRVYKAVE